MGLDCVAMVEQMLRGIKSTTCDGLLSLGQREVLGLEQHGRDSTF